MVGLAEVAANRQSPRAGELAAQGSLFPGSVNPGEIKGKNSSAEVCQPHRLGGVDLGRGGCGPREWRWQARTLPLARHPTAPPGKKRWSPFPATHLLAVCRRLAGVPGSVGGCQQGIRAAWGGFKLLLGAAHQAVRLCHPLKHSSSD